RRIVLAQTEARSLRGSGGRDERIVRVWRAQCRDPSSHLDKVERVILRFILQTTLVVSAAKPVRQDKSTTIPCSICAGCTTGVILARCGAIWRPPSANGPANTLSLPVSWRRTSNGRTAAEPLRRPRTIIARFRPLRTPA